MSARALFKQPFKLKNKLPIRCFSSTRSTNADFTNAVIGAGVGLATARQLAAREGTSTILLERHDAPGTETSRRSRVTEAFARIRRRVFLNLFIMVVAHALRGKFAAKRESNTASEVPASEVWVSEVSYESVQTENAGLQMAVSLRGSCCFWV
ncbi:hypothetical protein N7501_002037 [Penicillium viridicatum]|nr:hypothetical protein N7501_002037 [Penicillium viridicatum]